MTELQDHQADTHENDRVLLEETSNDSGHPDDALPAAGPHEAPLPEQEAEPVALEEAAAAGEEGPAPVPAQQLAGRVEALERQVEEAADRARLLSRVQALRKRVDEAPGETPGDAEEKQALAARLERLDGLVQEHLAENLRRKEALALQAAELCLSIEWRSASDAIKALQSEWKTIGPVPQERSQELWQSFRKAGNVFFERLQEHRKEQLQGQDENLRRKEELCVKAEDLSASTDWKGAAEAIKALQAEWRAVGPVPREHAEPIWKRFRKAADVFFERRKEHSDGLRKDQEENLRRKEVLVAKAVEFSQSTQWKATVQAIKELQAEWRTIGPAPGNKAEGVWRRFRAAIDLFFERQAAYFAGRNQDVEKRQDQMLDALERKREQANRVRESIERDQENIKRWQGSIAEIQPGDGSEETRTGLEAKISDVEGKIPAKRQRLDELEATIQEIAAKLK